MGVSAQSHFTRAPQQFSKAWVAGEICSHDQCVYETSDQAFDLGPSAVGDRRPNADVVLARVAMQQNLEGCQQGHKECRALAPAQCLKAVRQRFWEWAG